MRSINRRDFLRDSALLSAVLAGTASTGSEAEAAPAVSGVAVNLGLFSLLLAVGMSKYIASPVAIEASIVSNFLFNNYWTFRWRQVRGDVKLRGLKYNVVSFLSLAVSYATFVALSVSFPHVAPQIHQLVGIVPATLVNYFLNSYWTFKHDPIEIAAAPARSTSATSRALRREEDK